MLSSLISNMRLPSHKFFMPNESFLKYMEKFKNDLIYDVGAGCGHTSKLLNDNKFIINALEIILRDEMEFPVYHADALNFKFEENSVVMICRPCHGIFPVYTIKNAIRCGVKSIVYIGLIKNVVDDLDDYFYTHFKIVAQNVGIDGECIWEYDGYKNLY